MSVIKDDNVNCSQNMFTYLTTIVEMLSAKDNITDMRYFSGKGCIFMQGYHILIMKLQYNICQKR